MAQATAARLSLAIHIVRSVTSRVCARTSVCAMTPASSKSEMEMVPFGFSVVTSAADTPAENFCRHRMGDVLVSRASNHTPSIPCWQASQAPTSDGATGTSSVKRVGCA